MGKLSLIFKPISFINKRYISNNFRDKYEFTDRSNNNSNLVVILAGKKSYLWKHVFPRFYNHLDGKTDVVIANPGDLNPEEMRKIAKEYGFSYISTRSGKLATAVNIAIKLHGNAEWVYKLDDDVFINKSFFANLKETYERVKKDEIYEPGMVVPLINVNTFTFYHFLKTLDLVDEYTRKFGKIKFNGANSELYRNGQAAVYLWSKSLPIERTAEVFAEKNKGIVDVCPFRFSISAILFKRTLWEKMGGFTVSPPGTLGADEVSINHAILVNELSQIVVSLDTFVGHFGYFTHMTEMIKFFRENEASFMTQ